MVEGAIVLVAIFILRCVFWRDRRPGRAWDKNGRPL